MFSPFATAGKTNADWCPRCNTWLVVEFNGSSVSVRPPEKPNKREQVSCPHCKKEWEMWVTPDRWLSKIYGARQLQEEGHLMSDAIAVVDSASTILSFLTLCLSHSSRNGRANTLMLRSAPHKLPA